MLSVAQKAYLFDAAAPAGSNMPVNPATREAWSSPERDCGPETPDSEFEEKPVIRRRPEASPWLFVSDIAKGFLKWLLLLAKEMDTW